MLEVAHWLVTVGLALALWLVWSMANEILDETVSTMETLTEVVQQQDKAIRHLLSHYAESPTRVLWEEER